MKFDQCPICEKRLRSATGAVEFCQLCGMSIHKREYPIIKYQNEIVPFCSEECRDRYLEQVINADKYIKGEEKIAKDPVCGMEVRVNEKTRLAKYKGESYYFCSRKCKERFEENPKNFLKMMS